MCADSVPSWLATPTRCVPASSIDRSPSDHLPMRSVEEVRKVLSLVDEGLKDSEIRRQTGIPRGTIRAWRLGRNTRRDWRASQIQPKESCPACGHPSHRFNDLPRESYAYLLGLYLGDGCISTHPRGVFRLRITLDSKYPGIIAECAAAMGAVLPTSKVGVLWHTHQNSAEVSSFSRLALPLPPTRTRKKA